MSNLTDWSIEDELGERAAIEFNAEMSVFEYERNDVENLCDVMDSLID